ncbi:hypothetical protein P4119_03315 [Pseudomonas aeruginosa]|nr:hypothetical protein [Pseudomonas aeruginosa]
MGVAFSRNENKPNASCYFDVPLMVLAFYSCSGISAIMIFGVFLQQGISLEQLLNNPVSIGGIYAGKRYSGEIVSSVFSQVGLQCSYYTAVFGGLIYGARSEARGRFKLLFLLFYLLCLLCCCKVLKDYSFSQYFYFLAGC